MRIRCDVVCETGKVRDNNEDMALVFGEQVRDSALSFTCDVEDTTRFVAAVADGMGGHADGEVASAMATGSFNDFLAALPDGLDAEEVVKAVKQWGVDVSERMRTATQGSGMGCTFCGMFTYGGNAYVLNAGDSRLYRLRYGLFKQLTIDHSERVRQNDPAIPSNLIYNALGLDNVDRNILTTIIDKFDGGPVGLDTLAASTGEEATTIEDVYEPFLMQLGFIARTPRGRICSRRAYEHLGFTYRKTDASLLDWKDFNGDE